MEPAHSPVTARTRHPLRQTLRAGIADYVTVGRGARQPADRLGQIIRVYCASFIATSVFLA